MDDMVVTLCGRESVAGEYTNTENTEEVSLCRVLGVVRARIRLFVTHATRSPWYVVGVCACACARCVCVCVCVNMRVCTCAWSVRSRDVDDEGGRRRMDDGV